MKKNYAMLEEPDIRISLGANGLTTSGTFFIIVSLGFIAFLSYAIVAYAWYINVNINGISALIIMSLVLVSSIIMFLVSYSLSYEDQEITIINNKLVIKKNRPMWPGTTKTFDLDKVDGFAMEKLGFSFINVWYAFIFHKDFGADEVENFISPQVRLAGQAFSFLEYADDDKKKKALESLKQQLKDMN